MSRILTTFAPPADQPALDRAVSASRYYLQIGLSNLKRLNGGVKISFIGTTTKLMSSPLNSRTTLNLGEFGITKSILDGLNRNIKSLMFYPIGPDEIIVEFSNKIVEKVHYIRDSSGNFIRDDGSGGEGVKVKIPAEASH